MNTHFKWLSEENPLPALERKWQIYDQLSEADIAFLKGAQNQNPDIRVRESCRVLLAAIAGQSDGEPHVQRLLRLRNKARFYSLVRRKKSPASP
jgi:hypothetical protein